MNAKNKITTEYAVLLLDQYDDVVENLAWDTLQEARKYATLLKSEGQIVQIEKVIRKWAFDGEMLDESIIEIKDWE